MAALVSETLGSPGANDPFSLKPILFELEGGRCVGPIFPMQLVYLVSGGGRVGRSRRENGRKCTGCGSGGGSANTVEKENQQFLGGSKIVGAMRCEPTHPVPLGWGELTDHPFRDGPTNPAWPCYL